MKKCLFALACGTLALGIAEFVLMGILPNMADNLNISIIQAGHFISAYAIGVCVGAPLIVLFARKSPPKKILYGLVSLIILGNLCTALSPDYYTLLASRFISGLPHGSFFGVGSIVAERVSKEGKSAEAVAMMIAGMTIANLFGVPLGTFLSTFLSWRIIFFLICAIGVLVLYFIYLWVPKLESLPDKGLKGQFTFLKRKAPWLIILATFLGNAGFFCFYSYVSPVMTEVSGFTPGNMTFVMTLAGIGMVVGNLAGGKLSDKFSPQKVAAFTQLAICIALLGIFFEADTAWISLFLMTICTIGIFALSAPEQLLIIINSRESALFGAACVQVAFNLGNALGAYSGSIPIAAGYGYEYTALAGVPFAFIGFILLLYYTKYYSTPTEKQMKK